MHPLWPVVEIAAGSGLAWLLDSSHSDIAASWFARVRSAGDDGSVFPDRRIQSGHDGCTMVLAPEFAFVAMRKGSNPDASGRPCLLGQLPPDPDRCLFALTKRQEGNRS